MGRHPLDSADIERALALIEKGQQLGGHQPSSGDLHRAQRVLTGELSPEGARAEMHVALQAVVDNEHKI